MEVAPVDPRLGLDFHGGRVERLTQHVRLDERARRKARLGVGVALDQLAVVESGDEIWRVLVENPGPAFVVRRAQVAGARVDAAVAVVEVANNAAAAVRNGSDPTVLG